jgi:hypothetical protein
VGSSRACVRSYWKDHLRGRPYHISALFVVDLVKFRRKAYGDQYRIFYDSLSKDPNSLSNLDQDLPNYAQHVVPIHSLPEEWLWCETWCGNGTKPNAKTIDLCNNPLTKEPKCAGRAHARERAPVEPASALALSAVRRPRGGGRLNQATRIIGERWSALDARSAEIAEMETPVSGNAAPAKARDEL